MKSRGQGTFEYVLLLGGVLLIVVLAVVLLRGGLFQTGAQSVNTQACVNVLVKSGTCYDTNGNWVPSGVVGVPNPLPASCQATLGAAAPYSCTATQCLCGTKPT